MAEEVLHCEVCHRPTSGCNCGKPDEAFIPPTN